MKPNYWKKTIETMPPIRIAVPAFRINRRARLPHAQKHDELISEYRKDLERVMEKRPSGRICSRAV